MFTSPDNTVAVSERDGLPVLLLQGEITIDLAAELHRAAVAVAERGQDVLVDGAQAGRLDTTALQILLALQQDLASRGNALRLDRPTPAALQSLHLAGLGPALLGSTCAADLVVPGKTMRPTEQGE